jgi:hypothetical protein
MHDALSFVPQEDAISDQMRREKQFIIFKLMF